jgi:hydroxyethylthiazole kinase-like uncharacterized protein yjeF
MPLHAETCAQPLLRIDALRTLERAAAGLPLMQRAGEAAAALAASLARPGGAVLVLAGPGANGGDAFVTARELQRRFFAVALVFCGDAAQQKDDGSKTGSDTAAARRRFVDAGGVILGEIPDAVGTAVATAVATTARWSLIVDGLFGIGLTRPLAGRAAELVAAANALAARDLCPLLALDCPSGLDADTGVVRGPAIRASHTITFIAGKPGLFTGDGPDHCGETSVAALGLAAEVAAITDFAKDSQRGRLLTRAAFAGHLTPRARNTHKGSFGNAAIVGGAAGMVGAALLAARAALKLGSGRVLVGLLDHDAPAVDAGQPELMLRAPAALIEQSAGALLCGPGLGDSAAARELLALAIARDVPLLLDADALNLVANDATLQAALAVRPAPTLLTPHPAEAARLLATSVAAVQADRVGAALAIAARFQAQVVVKGCGSVVATSDGRWFVNTTGNPGMASAGMGDVLSGIGVALLAQGWPAAEALLAAVHLHGAAADRLVADGVNPIGPVGLTAGETIDAARQLFNRWCSAA